MARRVQLYVAAGLLAFAAAGPVVGGATARRLEMRDPGWELSGEGAVVEELDGEIALRLGTGVATYRQLELLDGTIEFDLQVTPYRSFAYLYFRMQSDGEHEEVYFRPHKSLLPDAIQYTPVYKGSSQWQLYHDAGATAAAAFPAGEWIPVKVVVQGSRAAVFVGVTDEPQLVVPELAREARPGYIALRAFRPRGVPEEVQVASFANLVVRPGEVDYQFPAVESPPPVAGRIASWELSPAIAPAEGLVTELPELPAGARWLTVPANADGLLEIERHVTRPAGVRRAAVLARHRVAVDSAATARLDLGFSDEVSVFLNGRLLVADDESYSFNLPRRQGLLTPQQLTVFLPLEAGDNELVLVVVDRFGGWGLSGRLTLAADAARGGPETATEAASGIGRLAWLEGCWRGEGGEECWLPARGGYMVGLNRGPDRDGGAPGFEFLRLVEDDEGLVFLAQPDGRSPATPFRAVEIGDSRVVFANPEHDFPQRITYWLDGATLRARVEAQRDGEWRGFELAWSPAAWSE